MVKYTDDNNLYTNDELFWVEKRAQIDRKRDLALFICSSSAALALSSALPTPNTDSFIQNLVTFGALCVMGGSGIVIRSSIKYREGGYKVKKR